MMGIRPLHEEQDYDWAIREAAHYFEVDPALGTAGNRFEVLSILIKDYEDKHFAMSHGDPVDVLRFAI
jgi:HTH-type transcriptional regulator/antitoxin HigA